MKPLVLADLIANTLCVMQSSLQRQGILLTVETPCDVPPVWGVAHQLEQVFLNILVNACHAMPAGGEMHIQADIADPEHVRVSFRDTGVGMSHEDVDRVFQPFVSLWEQTKRGLGLAICRNIMVQHQGDITLDSKPGEGATVTLTLLRADTAVSTQTPRSPP